jgi:hypothetical protein
MRRELLAEVERALAERLPVHQAAPALETIHKNRTAAA